MKKKLLSKAVMMIYDNILQIITLEHPTGYTYAIYMNALKQLENNQFFTGRS